VTVVRGGIVVCCVRSLRFPEAEEYSDGSICNRTDRSIEPDSRHGEIVYLCPRVTD
jgi:hypothetical protein